MNVWTYLLLATGHALFSWPTWSADAPAFPCSPGTTRRDDPCYRRTDACGPAPSSLDTQWLALALHDPWKRNLVRDLAVLDFNCRPLQHWNATCRDPRNRTALYWQIYHSGNHTRHLLPRNAHSFAVATVAHVDKRDECDLSVADLWPSSVSGPIALLAEYGTILPLAMLGDCFFSPVTSHPGLGFGSWKSNKLPRPCEQMQRLDWKPALQEGNFFIVWNGELGMDLPAQAKQFHVGMWEMIDHFFLTVFRLHLNHVPGPHACCSYFYADPFSLKSLAQLQMLAFLFFDHHYPRVDGRCPYVTFPPDQDHRCWAFAMERITATYMFLSGARWQVTPQCGLERTSGPEVILPHNLIRLVWNAAVAQARFP